MLLFLIKQMFGGLRALFWQRDRAAALLAASRLTPAPLLPVGCLAQHGSCAGGSRLFYFLHRAERHSPVFGSALWLPRGSPLVTMTEVCPPSSATPEHSVGLP